MITALDTLKELYGQSKEQMFEDFFTFLKFSSISTEPEHQPEVLACANWLKEYIDKMGFQTEFWETSGHPVIFASHLQAGPNKPTILIYHHYDVQPVDPLELWESPPFEPAIREGEIYARGAQDNKGQCFYVLQALKILLNMEEKLPVNVKLCIEGEEEAGSSGLGDIVEKKREQLKADYLAVVDISILQPHLPTITLGVRGIALMDVDVQASNTDLHSGGHGGIAYNPIHALAEVLSSLRDRSGKITIPGFYDEVKTLTAEEKSQLALDFDEKEYTKMFGAKPVGGESSFSPFERAWIRPTLEINGISGGYTGQGFKTVIPSKAHAKISCRLVPNQDPVQIAKRVADYIRENIHDGVDVNVTIHQGGGKAVTSDISTAIVQSFAQAYEEVFQSPTKYIFQGGSIPVIDKLREASGSAVVFVGLGLPGDHIHAPNEHFGIDRMEKGCLIMARTLQILGEDR
ncbi:MAG: dipeptidase [Waddliaceae bacterium]